MSTVILRALDATLGIGPCDIPDEQQTDVGRSADCRIMLPSKSVSRVHARFLRKGAALVLEDLGSSNGTAVNGSPIEGAVTVRVGDRIRFGSLEFVLEEAKPAEDEAATHLDPPKDPETTLAPPGRDAPSTPSTVEVTPSPTPPTAMPVAKVRAAAAPAAKSTREKPAAAGPASAIELALIAAGAYVAIVAAGLAVRWVFG